MERFEITIKNLKDNKIILNQKVNCIIGAVADSEKVTQIGLTGCSAFVIDNTIEGAKKVIDDVKFSVVEKNVPEEIADLLRFLKKEN